VIEAKGCWRGTFVFIFDTQCSHVQYISHCGDNNVTQTYFQHTCLRARINGREGVISAGGSSDASPALSSVEFYDVRKGKWLSLGRMRQGRRFPGLTVIRGNLILSGGEATDAFGRTVILDR